MKTTIFNFLVLQVVIWGFVFKPGYDSESDINYASLMDSWEVAKVGNNLDRTVLHYPTFNKLTLNPDGTYIRLKDDDSIETGTWKIDNFQSKLILDNGIASKKYEIVQLPETENASFIIKEHIEVSNKASNIKYELTRI